MKKQDSNPGRTPARRLSREELETGVLAAGCCTQGCCGLVNKYAQISYPPDLRLKVIGKLRFF